MLSTARKVMTRRAFVQQGHQRASTSLPIERYLRSFSSSDESGNGKSSDLSDKLKETIDTEGEWAYCSRKFMAPLQVPVRGADILTSPLYSKGTAFKSGERDRLRLRGLLPARRANMKIQKDRILKMIREEESDIRKNMILEDVHDRNETLYHRILVDHMEEMAPLIYTPLLDRLVRSLE